jgi:hypothetical protein
VSLTEPAGDLAEAEAGEGRHVGGHFVFVEAALLLVVTFAVAEPVAAIFFFAC